jgi:hypothetical protein
MLEALHKVRRGEQLPRVSWRKRRLFACACARRAWALFADECGRHAVAVAERYADQSADQSELRAAHDAARAAAGIEEWGVFPNEDDPDAGANGNLTAAEAAMRAAALAAAHPINAASAAIWSLQAVYLAAQESWPPPAPLSAPSFFGRVAERLKRMLEDDPVSRVKTDEQSAQCRLLACVYGNPFRPLQVDDSWLTWDGGTVQRLAWAADDERALPGGTLDDSRLAVLSDALEDAGCTDSNLLGHLRRPGPHARGCHVIDLLLGRQ